MTELETTLAVAVDERGVVKTEPPQWVKDYVQDCRRLLGVGDEWRILVHMVDVIPDNEDADGIVQADSRYFNATIHLLNSLQDDEYGHEACLHEVMHIALSPLSALFQQVLGDMSMAARMAVQEAYSNAEEQCIQRMTRAMLRMIKPETAKNGRQEPF